MYYSLLFHCNNGCPNAPQCYVVRNYFFVTTASRIKSAVSGWKTCDEVPQQWLNQILIILRNAAPLEAGNIQFRRTLDLPDITSKCCVIAMFVMVHLQIVFHTRTKCMDMSRDWHVGQNHNVKIYNKSFERAKHFRYLGTNLRNQNSVRGEIKNKFQ